MLQLFNEHLKGSVALAAALKTPVGSPSLSALRPTINTFKQYLSAMRTALCAPPFSIARSFYTGIAPLGWDNISCATVVLPHSCFASVRLKIVNVSNTVRINYLC